MSFQVIAYSPEHIDACLAIWNEVVRDGIAFPQENELNAETGHAFFSTQTFTGLARHEETGEIAGLYILHPNNVGPPRSSAEESAGGFSDERNSLSVS